jgi:surface polysaccharide O-acyltransferase-like enzyme
MTWELSDLLRAIATTIVISIHASHHWWFGVKDTVTINPEIFIDTFINQVGRFTVPMFVVLSGFALSKSEEKHPFDLKIFFQRRLWRIIPPYVLFTLLNVVGRSQFLMGNWQERFQQIWQALSTGMGDYHLYFLGIILQCYVSYPFLRRIAFTVKKLWILLTIAFSLFSLRWISATFGLLPNLTSFLPDGNHVIYWLPYFQIGIWLAKDHGWSKQLVSQWRSRTWGYLFAIASILELGEFYATAILKNSAEAVGHYTRPTIILVTLTFLLWTISWQIKEPIKAILSNKIFASASFTTYLIHVWILRAIAPLEVVGGILYVPLAATVSWLIGITIWRLVKVKRWSAIAFGA